MVKPVSKWICGRCDKSHDYEEDAAECCRPDIFENWICSSCGEYHEVEGYALDCCREVIIVEEKVTAADLEKAGQMRLLP